MQGEYHLFARLRVRPRLVLLVSLVLLPLACLHAWTILQRMDDQLDSQLKSNAELVETARVAMSTFIHAQLVLNQTMGEAIADHYTDDSEIRMHLQARKLNSPYSHRVSWINPQGVIQVSTSPALEQVDVTDREYVRQLIAGADQVVSDLLIGRDNGVPIFAIANAIRRNGALVGIIATSFDGDRLSEVLNLTWDRSVRIGVVDRHGKIIYLQGVSSAGLPWERRYISHNERSPAALALRTGQPALTKSFTAVADGQDRMGAATPIEHGGWVLTATTRIDEVLAPARSRAMVELGVLVLVSGLALAGAWLVAAGIVNPAKALQRAALAYAAGDRSARAGPYGGDELSAAAAMFDQMAEEVAYTEAELRRKTEELTLVIESTTDGVMLLDDQWRLTYLNRSGERMLQRSRDELAGCSLWDAFPDATDTEFYLQYLRAMEERVSADFEEYYPPLNAWFQIQPYPFLDGLAIFFKDITARKAGEANLRRHSALLDRQRQILELIATGAPLPAILSQIQSLVHEQHSRCCTSVLLPAEDLSGRRTYPEAQLIHTFPDGRPIQGGWSVPVMGVTGEPVCALVVLCTQAGVPTPDEIALTETAASLAGIAVESHQREAGPARKLQALMAHMSEGVIAVDAGQNVILVNQAAGRLLSPGGHPDSAGLELSCLPPDLRAAIEEAGMWGGDSMRVRFRVGAAELEAQVTPVNTELGRYGTMAVLRDVTAQEQFRRLQQSFVANVSHELRGPLATMSATLEAMADGLIPEANRPRYFKALLQEMARLRRLSYDVVDLTRMDSGVLQIQQQEIDMEELFGQLLVTFDQRAAAANLKIEAEPTGEWAYGDFDRVGQVVTNLVENSLRFTPPGGAIRLSANREGDRIRISVSDTGIGIPPEHLAHIWERFYKVDPARTFSPGSGTGLGLSIVRQLVHLMGGEVTVQSGVGQGSVFSFTLPAV